MIQTLPYHLRSLYLFTQSDISTTIIPVTLFALAAAPIYNLVHCIHVILWIWVHLLQFDVANQIVDPEEDSKNKASRPIPAGRITLQNATYLRWILVPFCLAYSAFYSIQVLGASAAIAVLTILYHEGRAHGHWLSKNVITAVTYGAFELGATIVAGRDYSHVENTGLLSVAISVAIQATTLQAQDFKDVEGDHLIGRLTIPIVFPTLSRPSMLIGLFMWSVYLTKVWCLDWASGVAFIVLSVLVGARFVLYKERKADKKSCKYYSLWSSVVYLLPAYWRYFHAHQA
ncbi:UbiA prenyltransferase family [Hygrophoropsis aurantiaca]|uniref:UbiA prenyltransferase family n=1 Tax=Hygrophoropsis aurantiaca TaxID=72124 RepID=A0ACB8A4T7_9AGAM|nr:UbiA prenyltransferase family [Hygrophoropsis aurantiaca]